MATFYSIYTLETPSPIVTAGGENPFVYASQVNTPKQGGGVTLPNIFVGHNVKLMVAATDAYHVAFVTGFSDPYMATAASQYVPAGVVMVFDMGRMHEYVSYFNNTLGTIIIYATPLGG